MDSENTQHIRATIAQVEQRKTALRNELEETDRILDYLRKMLGDADAATGGTHKVQEPEVDYGKRLRARIHANGAAKPTDKAPSIPALALKVVADAGRFLHRSEMEKAIADAGYQVKGNSLGAVLSALGKDGKLVKFRFDHTFNTIHWGLPEWVTDFLGDKVVLPQHAPQGDVAQRFRLEDARFDV